MVLFFCFFIMEPKIFEFCLRLTHLEIVQIGAILFGSFECSCFV